MPIVRALMVFILLSVHHLASAHNLRCNTVWADTPIQYKVGEQAEYKLKLYSLTSAQLINMIENRSRDFIPERNPQFPDQLWTIVEQQPGHGFKIGIREDSLGDGLIERQILEVYAINQDSAVHPLRRAYSIKAPVRGTSVPFRLTYFVEGILEQKGVVLQDLKEAFANTVGVAYQNDRVLMNGWGTLGTTANGQELEIWYRFDEVPDTPIIQRVDVVGPYRRQFISSLVIHGKNLRPALEIELKSGTLEGQTLIISAATQLRFSNAPVPLTITDITEALQDNSIGVYFVPSRQGSTEYRIGRASNGTYIWLLVTREDNNIYLSGAEATTYKRYLDYANIVSAMMRGGQRAP